MYGVIKKTQNVRGTRQNAFLAQKNKTTIGDEYQSWTSFHDILFRNYVLRVELAKTRLLSSEFIHVYYYQPDTALSLFCSGKFVDISDALPHAAFMSPRDNTKPKQLRGF